jgi:hypothetical protein
VDRVRVRDLTRGGYKEQVRGYARDACPRGIDAGMVGEQLADQQESRPR